MRPFLTEENPLTKEGRVRHSICMLGGKVRGGEDDGAHDNEERFRCCLYLDLLHSKFQRSGVAIACC